MKQPIKTMISAVCLTLAQPWVMSSAVIAQEPVSAPDETTQGSEETASNALTLDEIRALADVFNLVRNNYVDEITEQDLLYSAMRGMVGSLDRHSAYLGAEQFTTQDNSAKGRNAGVGIEVEVVKGRLLISAVYESGPAEAAGLLAGDTILAVNGQKVRGRPLGESIADIAGAPGTTVTLRVRDRHQSRRSVKLERAMVPVPSVRSTLLEGRIAYLALNQFHLHSAEEIDRHLERLTAQSQQGLRGIVLDLRDNPGGVIKAAMDIADGFLGEGLVVYTKGRYPEAQLEYFAEPGEWSSGTPLALLINGSSASSAEILAAALQDHGRATLIGSNTYGKGTVQSVLRLRNGSALKLTTARYYSPAGNGIDGTGVAPDVNIGPEDQGKTLSGSWKAGQHENADGIPQEDLSLQEAVRLINNGLVATGSRP